MSSVAGIIQGIISPVTGRTYAVDVSAVAAKVVELRPDLASAALQDAVVRTAISLGLPCFWSGQTAFDGAARCQRLDRSIAA